MSDWAAFILRHPTEDALLAESVAARVRVWLVQDVVTHWAYELPRQALILEKTEWGFYYHVFGLVTSASTLIFFLFKWIRDILKLSDCRKIN